MGSGASRVRPGVSAPEEVAEETSNALEEFTEVVPHPFTGLADSERERVIRAASTTVVWVGGGRILFFFTH